MRFNITPILGLAAMATAAVASPFDSSAIGPRSIIDGTSHLSTRSFAPHDAMQARALPEGSLPQFDKRAMVKGLLEQLNPWASSTKKQMHRDNMRASFDSHKASVNLRVAKIRENMAKKGLDKPDDSQYGLKRMQYEDRVTKTAMAQGEKDAATQAAEAARQKVKNKEWRNPTPASQGQVDAETVSPQSGVPQTSPYGQQTGEVPGADGMKR